MGKAYKLGGGKTGFYRRIAWDRPSPTLVTSPTMPATDLCHPKELRPLSVEEYKRVQGFLMIGGLLAAFTTSTAKSATPFRSAWAKQLAEQFSMT